MYQSSVETIAAFMLNLGLTSIRSLNKHCSMHLVISYHMLHLGQRKEQSTHAKVFSKMAAGATCEQKRISHART